MISSLGQRRYIVPCIGWYRIQPVWLNGTTPRYVIPSGVEESSQVADFTLRWYFLPRGGFLHSACATVGMTGVSGLAGADTNVPRFRPCGRMAADCRRYTGVQPNTRNNVAALTQRHPAPARGWLRGMLRIRTSNEWPYGQWRQIAAATVGGTIQYTEQCSGVDPTPLQPRRGAGPVGCY